MREEKEAVAYGVSVFLLLYFASPSCTYREVLEDKHNSRRWIAKKKSNLKYVLVHLHVPC